MIVRLFKVGINLPSAKLPKYVYSFELCNFIWWQSLGLREEICFQSFTILKFTRDFKKCRASLYVPYSQCKPYWAFSGKDLFKKGLCIERPRPLKRLFRFKIVDIRNAFMI